MCGRGAPQGPVSADTAAGRGRGRRSDREEARNSIQTAQHVRERKKVRREWGPHVKSFDPAEFCRSCHLFHSTHSGGMEGMVRIPLPR